MTAHCAGMSQQQCKSANLMISELVSNAYQHGKGRIELTVHSGAEGVHASVHDEGEGMIAQPDPLPERGCWGLYFVDRLADGWGVAPDASQVWFRVATTA